VVATGGGLPTLKLLGKVRSSTFKLASGFFEYL
jgi:hypothetical protein